MGNKILRVSDLTEVREADVPRGDDASDATRDDILRGKHLPNGQPLAWGVNDQRDGLPAPMRGKPVNWTSPQPTTAPITNPEQLSPDTNWAQLGQTQFLATGNTSPYQKSPGSPTMRGDGSMNDAQRTPTSGLGYTLSASKYRLARQMQDEGDRQ